MLPFRRGSMRFFGLVLVLISTLVLSACGTEHAQTTLSPQGDSAREILSLFNIFFYVAIGVFVVVEGLLIYSAFRYRRRPDDGIPLQIHGNQPIEIIWTIVPAVIVLFLATMTFRTQSLLVAAPQEEPLRVTVVGHQWWWEFRYPDLGVVTANELHLPGNRHIEFTLESADVIHSFWFPRLSGKTDAIPGHANRMAFRTDDVTEPMLIRGQCAEFCGGTHAQMGMFAVVQPPGAFEEWVARQQADAVVPEGVTQTEEATPPIDMTPIATTEEATPIPEVDVTQPTPVAQPASLEARGYELFRTKACVGCHAIAGYPEARGLTGPDLTHVGSRQHIVAGWLENTPENMARWLRDPNEVKPDNIMGQAIRAGTLTEDEIEALTAYLESLE
jgi:cytochrome c oxidase subunit II